MGGPPGQCFPTSRPTGPAHMAFPGFQTRNKVLWRVVRLVQDWRSSFLLTPNPPKKPHSQRRFGGWDPDPPLDVRAYKVTSKQGRVWHPLSWMRSFYFFVCICVCVCASMSVCVHMYI